MAREFQTKNNFQHFCYNVNCTLEIIQKQLVWICEKSLSVSLLIRICITNFTIKQCDCIVNKNIKKETPEHSEQQVGPAKTNWPCFM